MLRSYRTFNRKTAERHVKAYQREGLIAGYRVVPKSELGSAYYIVYRG